MAHYLEIDEARDLPGLRLVLTAGVPGPFCEAARYVFDVKKIPYTRVRQVPLRSDASLLDWTRQTSAPVAVYGEERPRASWVEILCLAESLVADPGLIPEAPDDRIQMFGLSNEICGDLGFGWQRRLMMCHAAASADGDGSGVLAHLGRKYGYSQESGEASAQRAAGILRTLSGRLLAQRERGSRFFVGDKLSATDLHWAAFSAMLEPMADDVCPIPEGLRAGYSARDPQLLDAADAILLEHRDFIFREFIGLPLDF